MRGKNQRTSSAAGAALIPLAYTDLSALLKLTGSPSGEIEIYNKAVRNDPEGVAWLAAVARGLRGGTDLERELASRPLVTNLIAMTSAPLTPSLENLRTPPERTPWGGTRLSEILKDMPVRLEDLSDPTIGELWTISGHRSFPNVFQMTYGENRLPVPISILGALAPEALYGKDNVERFGPLMPFLSKFLNSRGWEAEKRALEPVLSALDADPRMAGWKKAIGHVMPMRDLLNRNYHELMQALNYLAGRLSGDDSAAAIKLRAIRQRMLEANLSVQIHPPKGYDENKPSKTEAWVILESEIGAGIYLGLKEGVTKEQMQAALDTGADVTNYLNFIETKPGDIFFIPAGTPHAIGAGLLIYEPQETSESTFRYYDYDREPKRELHVKDAMAVTDWDAPRGKDAVEFYRRIPLQVKAAVSGTTRAFSLIDDEVISLQRIDLRSADTYYSGPVRSIHGLTVAEGKVSLLSQDKKTRFAVLNKGQSVLLPAAMDGYAIVASEGVTASIFRTAAGTRERETTVAAHMRASGADFGTSGVRGLVTKLTDEACYVSTVGFIKYLREIGQLKYANDAVVIAGDLRPSTDRIMLSVAKAISDSGHRVVNLGKIPSPALANYGFTNNMPSIMITGSHIPSDRNGIKFNMAKGEVLKRDEAGIKRQTVVLPKGTFDESGMFAEGMAPAMPEAEPLGEELYVQRYLGYFPKELLKGRKIGLYEHSAVGRDIFRRILEGLGAEVTSLGRSDDFIPVDTEAIRPEDRSAARSWMKEHGFDVIVGTDGDSDRPFMVDEKGNWLRGDTLGILAARAVRADAVVTPVSSNTAADKSGYFSEVRRTKIGSPYVIEAMNSAAEKGAKMVVGYEVNGGLLTASDLVNPKGVRMSPLPTRDAVLPILSVLELMKDENVTLSQLAERLPQRFTASDRVKEFPTEQSRAIIEALRSGGAEEMERIFSSFGKVVNIDSTDGLRVTTEHQEVFHLRPSGNAPELRGYVEADSEKRADEMLGQLMAMLKTWKKRSPV